VYGQLRERLVKPVGRIMNFIGEVKIKVF